MNKKKFRENPTAFFFYQNPSNDPKSVSIHKKAQAYAANLYNANQCFLCTKQYNLFEHVPRILPQCGCTLCSKCLTHFWKKTDLTLRCPICMKLLTSVPSIEKMPVNHVIFSQLTIKSKISQENSSQRESHDNDASSDFNTENNLQIIQGNMYNIDISNNNKTQQTNTNNQNNNYDSYELEICSTHTNKVKHFFCIKHKIQICRLCFIEKHSNNTNCKVIDIYDLEQENLSEILYDSPLENKSEKIFCAQIKKLLQSVTNRQKNM